MPINFSGSYSQNFDGLATSGTNNAWNNDSTFSGWSLFRQPTPGTAIAAYNADNGGSNTGTFYSYGTTSSTDRALGGLGSGGTYFGSPTSGSVAGWIAFAATNTTGSTISNLNVGFNGEQWRNGGNTTAQSMVLQYGFGTSFDTVSSWNTPGGTFNWTSPVATATGAAVDGNVAGRVANLGGTLSNLNWANNNTLWIRWIENNDTGNDHGLAIDDFSITTVPVVIPTVTISTTDATAAEAGTDPGTFRITRTGDTTNALTVNYTVATGSGQATNGTDYTPNLTGTATIAAGQSFVDIAVTPIDDTTVEGNETVTLNLVDTAEYDLGATTQATVAIADNDVAPGAIRITEYMYSGVNGEFVEFTNVGGSTVDMTGWSFDDSSRTPGSFSLSSFGVVQAGESVILTESAEATFRTAWGLPNTVKVIGGLNQNLGRADEINLYDSTNAQIDRLTYDDQTIGGSIRTQNVSGWTNDANLGNNTILNWQLSAVPDAKISYASTGGDIGNPGGYVIQSGVTIRQSSASTDIAEGGATDSYTVVLNTQPTADVTIAIASGTQTSTNTNNLTFTSANWNVAQTVTVTAVDDAVQEGNHTGAITHTATSSDATYNGISIAAVTANITDNDFNNNLPTISENSATPFLNLATTGTGYVSAAINDPTDPAKFLGIDFTVADVETANPTVSIISSSNTSVVPIANLNLTNTSGNNYNLKINPAGVGYSDITVRVTDGSSATTDYVIKYAASAASVNPTTTRFLTGASDASTAIAIDSNYMLVADDEDQKLRLYDRSNSGLPLNNFDFTSSLGLTDISGGVPREVDIEASTKIGDRIYWLGSHSNSSSGSSRPNRYRLFATDISGTGSSSTLSYVGRYDNLRTDLITWGDANGYGFSNSAATGVIPEAADGSGFNIEGLTIAPNNTTAYIAFRAPNVPTATRQKALIAPITNFTDLVTGAATNANIGAPIELDLGGRGIRSIERNANNQYLIIAGPPDGATGVAPKDFRLYSWTGNVSDTPQLLLTDLTGLNSDGSFESIVEVPNSLTSGTQLQLLVDNGDSVFYNDGVIAKELTQDNWQKFRSEIVTISASTKIHDIQGTGATFNPTFGGVQTIEGIVTRAFQSASNLNGFYVQEEDADADSDPTTSEAIFVYDPSGLFTGNVGDKVRITGTVSEYTSSSGGNTSSLTQLSSLTNVTNLGASTLPTVTNIQLPVTNASDLERYEGMLVNVSAASGDLTVTENYQLGRYGQVVLAATGASNQTGTDARLDQYTQFNNPSVSGYAAYQAEIAKRRIYLDDGRSSQNPDPILFGRGGNPLSASNTLRSGDTVANITGVLDQRFEGYRIQTSSPVNFTPTNARTTTPPSVGGSLKVASFNVLNYFNGDGTGGGFPTARGAENTTEFTRQRDKIIQAIIGTGADVLGLMELENDGYSSTSAIQDLVNGLNAVAGAGTYTFVNPGTSLATDQITVGLIYKPSQVTPVGAAATIPNAYGTGAFDLVGRKPLAQTFQQTSTGGQFTVVVNHFKSKGSSAGAAGDADASDGQGFSNGTRTRQAQDLAAWLATNPTGTTDSDYLIVGDLNAYAKEDPVTTLASAGYNSVLPITSYSYVFDGQVGSLDHALATSSLAAQVTGAEKWHINADEPSVLDYNTNFKSAGQVTSLYNADSYRSSDHDPVIVGLNLTTPAISIEAIDANASETGSDTGSFRISRSGGGSVAALNVSYTVAGQASSNDYTPALTGVATIAAGQSFVDVTVTPVDDSFAEGSETLTLNLVDTADYDLGANNFATVTIADNDTAGVTISKSNTNIAEGGVSDSYTVVLATQPTADVTIAFNTGNQISAIGNLNFTPNNWNVPQSVSVVAVDDNLVEGNHAGTISHQATSNDASYNGWQISSVVAQITDNDTASTDDCCGCDELEKLVDASYQGQPTPGNPPNDLIIGDAKDNIFLGGIGNDTILGVRGDDLLFGNEGQDVINGNEGSDIIFAGKGDDFVRGGQNDDYLSGDLGNDTLSGDAGQDIVLGMLGDDILLGNKGNDVLNGNQGNDTVCGGEGNDLVNGGQDDDLVSGGSGNDTLYGDNGDDTLCGCEGNDWLTGGAGRDIFGLKSGAGSDIITDFVVGKDLLKLANNLTFSNLTIKQGSGNQLGNTLIRVTATNELLASLIGVAASSINASAIAIS